MKQRNGVVKACEGDMRNLIETNDDRDLVVCSLRDLKDIAFGFDADLIISISDPNSPEQEQRIVDSLSPEQRAKTVRLRFEDARTGDAAHLINKGTLIEALKCAARPQNRRVLIHCQAGVSRSPAVALGVLAIRAVRSQKPTQELAVDLVRRLYEIVPVCAPNKNVVEAVDAVLGFFGSLSAEIEKGDAPRSGLIL